jgi:hypothetical protein
MQEAKALGAMLEFETGDLVKIALKVANAPKLNKTRARIVILTRGSGPVLLVQGTYV